jgi:rhodanese-related sulfurtransferase
VSGVSERSLTRVLAVVALTLGVLAAFAGSPYRAGHASVDIAALARSVEREEDHVTALELAQWIKDRRRGLRVIDVRSAEEFEAYHVPGAERIPLDSLATSPFQADETLVLYSEGGAHAAQAWVFLRALGYRKVFFLRGGLYEWLDEVMNPTLAADASPAARAEFATAAGLSRYFGGVPRSNVAVPATDVIALPRATRDSGTRSVVPLPTRTNARVLQLRRRGC